MHQRRLHQRRRGEADGRVPGPAVWRPPVPALPAGPSTEDPPARDPATGLARL
jgi:hypothetical protein